MGIVFKDLKEAGIVITYLDDIIISLFFIYVAK